ncbi:phage baseplate assembly protein [Komagataeibacter sp. FNDCR2]|uniref:phage baseplate assembly protein n=1 Tax=Komagataeibacter sp. FNDCR2 TaxID=2878682 RepID=UPI001E3DE0A2|nr:phage baseplate assembly protein [Komagataeibacter sp. FNDCR2]MCE2576021.1 phage baseplate assembly protein [Komagataeibacter sp. FNDCR2]
MRHFLRRLFGIGRTSSVPNDTGPIQLVQVALNEYETLDGREVFIAYGLISCPPVGADVLLTCTGGKRTDSVVTGHNHQKYRYRNAQPGEAGIANPVVGTVILARANGDVYIKPASGTVIVDGGTITADDFVTKNGVKLSDHVHGGVQQGDSRTKGPQE